MPLEGRKLHVAISEKETCPIHRDWHDEETDFKEKSVRYTEIRHTISHMKSRMRESRTSGSVRGVPCERYVYSTLLLQNEQNMTKKSNDVEGFLLRSLSKYDILQMY